METRLAAVRAAMERYFADDARRIDHALRVTDYARRLLLHEPGDRELVLATALLHDIGIPEAERKYASSAGNLQEIEGPPVASVMLEALEYRQPFIQEVCQIIAAHHSPGEVDTNNFRVVWDADWLVNLTDEYPLADERELRRLIQRIFMTDSGRRLAGEIYLNGQKG